MTVGSAGQDSGSSVRLASFDVFDTLLTRVVGAPEATFLLLGNLLSRKGLLTCSAHAFAHGRRRAEARAYRNVRASVTLDDIYRELGGAGVVEATTLKRVAEEEQELESRLTRVIPRARELLRAARESGAKVVFVSDIYLPAPFVQKLLELHGLFVDGDALYVSSDTGSPKRNGDLYRDVQAREAVVASAITHLGDDVECDIDGARKAGIAARRFADADLTRYERALNGYAWETDGLAALMAGASRLARMAVTAHSTREEALRDVAAGVVAPTLTGFVVWTLRRAKAMGVQRLYFIARDGQILLELARILAPKLDYDGELRYLFGSRQAWNFPGIDSGSRDEFAWVWDSTEHLSARDVLARVSLTPEEVSSQLVAGGIDAPEWSLPLTDVRARALSAVLQQEDVRTLIVTRAHDRRRMLVRYLQDEGVGDEQRWGVVDLGWHGSMQDAIGRIINEIPATRPVGFYFALRRSGAFADGFRGHKEAYFFDERRRLGYIKLVPTLVAFLEAFCAGDHGTVLHFREDHGRITPVLKEEQNTPVLAWGLPLMRETVSAFAEHLWLDQATVNFDADVREAVVSILRMLTQEPAAAEARVWGAFPWEDGIGEHTYWTQLAEPYRWRDLPRTFRRGRIAPHHRASWYAGSLAVTPRAIAASLRVAARLGQLIFVRSQRASS